MADDTTIETALEVINSTRNSAQLNRFIDQQPETAHRLLNDHCWDIVDTLFYLQLSCALTDSDMAEHMTTIQHVGDCVKPRELLLIGKEKIFSCSSVNALQAILYTLQLGSYKLDDVVELNATLASVLAQMRNMIRTNSQNAEEEAQTSDADEPAVASVDNRASVNVVDLVGAAISFAVGLICNDGRWHGAGTPASAPPTIFSQAKRAILIGYLLNLCSDGIAMVKDSARRLSLVHQCMDLLIVLDVNLLDDLTPQLHRDRYRCCRELRLLPPTTSLPQQKEVIQLTKDTATYVLNSLASSNFDSDRVQVAFSTSQDHNSRLKVHISSTTHFSQLPVDAITDRFIESRNRDIAAHLHTSNSGNDRAYETISYRISERLHRRTNRTSNSIDTATATSLVDCISVDLPWTIVGVAMVVTATLQQLLEPSIYNSSNNKSSGLIAVGVYSVQHIYSCCVLYSSALLRHSGMASAEGLQLMVLLHKLRTTELLLVREQCACPTASSNNNNNNNNNNTNVKTRARLFCSFLADHSVDDLVNAMRGTSRHCSNRTNNNCFDNILAPVAHNVISCLNTYSTSINSTVGSDMSRISTAEVCFSQSALQSLTAAALDAMAVTQCIVNALAASANDSLRQQAFESLRGFLKQFQDAALLVLLLALVERCPFLSIAGLLVDVVKEVVQCAATNASRYIHSMVGVRWQELATTETVAMLIVTQRQQQAGVDKIAIAATSGSVGVFDNVIKTKRSRKWYHVNNESSAGSSDVRTLRLTDLFDNFDPSVHIASVTTANNGDFGDNSFNNSKLADHLRRVSIRCNPYRYFTNNCDSGTEQNSVLTAAERDIYLWHNDYDIINNSSSNNSIFWSATVVRHMINAYLDRVVHWDCDKIEAEIDVLSARLNLLLFVALKLAPTLQHSGAAVVNSDSYDVNVLDLFVEDRIRPATTTEKKSSSNKIKNIQELFIAFQLVNQLLATLDSPLKVEHAGNKSRSKVDPAAVVRRQLLVDNVHFVRDNLSLVCCGMVRVLARLY